MAPARPPRLIIGGATASCAKQEVNDVSLSPSNTKAISRARLAGGGVAFSIGPGVSSGLFSIWRALITQLPKDGSVQWSNLPDPELSPTSAHHCGLTVAIFVP